MKQFNQVHPLLDKLLTKLANPSYSIRDIIFERIDWVKAGCPVKLVEDVTREGDRDS